MSNIIKDRIMDDRNIIRAIEKTINSNQNMELKDQNEIIEIEKLSFDIKKNCIRCIQK